MTLLSSIDDDALQNYLRECARVSSLNPRAAFKLTKAHVGAHGKKGASRPKKLMDLEERWYRSLYRNPNAPLYRVYDDPLYLCDLWLCWVAYSRRYLTALQKPDLNGRIVFSQSMKPKTVLDLGCGCGYSTAALKQLFPKARVVGTNLKGTCQFKLASRFGREFHFEVTEDYGAIRADLIFASEYFEHWQEPLPHLTDILVKCRPKYLITANAFTAKSIGHFDQYLDAGNWVTGKQMSGRFNRTLRENGYNEIAKFYNARPRVWSREL